MGTGSEGGEVSADPQVSEIRDSSKSKRDLEEVSSDSARFRVVKKAKLADSDNISVTDPASSDINCDNISDAKDVNDSDIIQRELPRISNEISNLVLDSKKISNLVLDSSDNKSLSLKSVEFEPPLKLISDAEISDSIANIKKPVAVKVKKSIFEDSDSDSDEDKFSDDPMSKASDILEDSAKEENPFLEESSIKYSVDASTVSRLKLDADDILLNVSSSLHLNHVESSEKCVKPCDTLCDSISKVDLDMDDLSNDVDAKNNKKNGVGFREFSKIKFRTGKKNKPTTLQPSKSNETKPEESKTKTDDEQEDTSGVAVREFNLYKFRVGKRNKPNEDAAPKTSKDETISKGEIFYEIISIVGSYNITGI